eukprot:140424_1
MPSEECDDDMKWVENANQQLDELKQMATNTDRQIGEMNKKYVSKLISIGALFDGKFIELRQRCISRKYWFERHALSLSLSQSSKYVSFYKKRTYVTQLFHNQWCNLPRKNLRILNRMISIHNTNDRTTFDTAWWETHRPVTSANNHNMNQTNDQNMDTDTNHHRMDTKQNHQIKIENELEHLIQCKMEEMVVTLIHIEK